MFKKKFTKKEKKELIDIFNMHMDNGEGKINIEVLKDTTKVEVEGNIEGIILMTRCYFKSLLENGYLPKDIINSILEIASMEEGEK